MKFLSRAAKLFRRNGWRKYRARVEGDRRRAREAENFQKWILANQLTEARREAMRREIESFSERPLISVLLPVYNVEEKWLRLCIESVTNQIYENWELCIADDCSPAWHVKKVLEEYVADERIKVVFRPRNGHISAASNSALELATGKFVGLLDHDDELSADALFHVVKEINAFPKTDFVYSDEDMIDEAGNRYAPKFKPDFSLDFLRSVNYVTHFAVYRREILQRVSGFRVGLEGSQDYDLALRVVEQISGKNIRHIPRIIYHWRAIRGSIALSGDEKPYAHQRARQAIHEHLKRTGKQGKVEAAINNLHRVRYELPDELPKVDLILAVDEDLKFAKQAVESYIEQTDYANLEITLIEGSAGQKKIAFPPNVKFIAVESASEAERFNRAIAQTTGDVLCFADANLRPLAKDWLKELVGFALQTEIGAVGAKILNWNETVLHGGLILGDADELVSLAHRGHTRNSSDNIGRLQLINNFSAVSISCLTTSRKAFESIGGFDAKNFPNRFFDADFCLRLREKNYRIVYTPYAELMKINRRRRLIFEKNPIAVEEKKKLVEKWNHVIERDPFYNLNLSKRNANFSIEI